MPAEPARWFEACWDSKGALGACWGSRSGYVVPAELWESCGAPADWLFIRCGFMRTVYLTLSHFSELTLRPGFWPATKRVWSALHQPLCQPYKLLFWFYMYVFWLVQYVSCMCLILPEARRAYQISWNQSYKGYELPNMDAGNWKWACVRAENSLWFLIFSSLCHQISSWDVWTVDTREFNSVTVCNRTHLHLFPLILAVIISGLKIVPPINLTLTSGLTNKRILCSIQISSL